MIDILNPSTPVGTTTSSGEAAGLMVSANGGNFTPSSVGSSSFTMDGTAQGEAIASGVTKLQVVNTGVTTEAIYVSFGTTQVAADTQLAIAARSLRQRVIQRRSRLCAIWRKRCDRCSFGGGSS